MEWQKLSSSKEGEKLALKGFLYQTGEGNWILSNEPHLKSCCLGKKELQHTQIQLLGDFSNADLNKPLHVEGTLHVASAGAYVLSDVKTHQKESFPFFTLGALLLLIGFTCFKLRRLLLP